MVNRTIKGSNRRKRKGKRKRRMEATPDHLEAVEERPWKQLVASDSMDGATLASATQFPTIFRSFSLFLFFYPNHHFSHSFSYSTSNFSFSFAFSLFSRMLRDSIPRFVRPSVRLTLLFFCFLRSLASLILPKC